MTTRWRKASVILLSGLVLACGQGDAPETAADDAVPEAVPATPEWVTELAEVASAIRARPDAVDSVLAAHDLTRAAFDSLIYRVAADHDLAAAYGALLR